MRVLLDECLPRRLGRWIEGHAEETVPGAGWAGKSNGELLRLAAAKFDVFVTIDANLEYPQRLRGGPIAVIVLGASRNRFEALLPLVPELERALAGPLNPGVVLHVRA